MTALGWIILLLVIAAIVVVLARIRIEQEIQSTSIQRELQIREAEIAQLRALEIAEQDKVIQTAAKSEEESKARAEATMARAQLVKAEEEIQTLREMAEAERRKSLALLAAQQDAEANAERARITSVADQEVAKAKGAIRREEAASMKVYKTAEAERIKAENTRSKELMAMDLEQARLEAMPKILAEMVKPAEKIQGININHVTGLGRTEGGGTTSPVNQTIDSILDMAVALSAMDKIGDQIGGNLDGEMPEADKKS